MKDHFKRLSLAVPALLLAMATMTAVPALAQSNASGSVQSTDISNSKSETTSGSVISNSNSGSSTTSKTVTTDNTSNIQVETETHKTLVKGSDDNQTSELHSKGKALVAELQKEHKSKLTDTQRSKVCEVHKQGLTNKFTVIARNSLSYQTRIDDIYTKALAFQTSKNVTSTELTSLIATANAAKATSVTSVANLQALKPTLDCNNATVAQDVATFKTAAGQTRADLKSYKAAVKAVIQSLKSATTTSTDTTTIKPLKTTSTEKGN